jgi:hypothetical protein
MFAADEILRLRLERQLIECPAAQPTSAPTPASVVQRLCAIQAQDYAGALWAIGLRSGPDCTAADVEGAIAEKRIVRTWPVRGTLHFVAPDDVRWMLSLLSPRVLSRARTRHEQLGVTEHTIERAGELLTDRLAGGHSMTRRAMMQLLEVDGIDTAGQRGYHVLWALAQQAVLCCGPMEGRQQTFVLLDEWIPHAEEPTLDPAAALSRLAARYCEARGPATIADLAWWAGITKTEARAGLEGAGDRLRRVATTEGEYLVPAGPVVAPPASPHTVHLLPAFDEYFLGYTDRRLALGEHGAMHKAMISANGMFSPTVVIGGRVAGTWRRTVKRRLVEVTVRAFRTLGAAEQRELAESAERYARFLGMPEVRLDVG